MMLENDVSATEGVVLDPISPKQATLRSRRPYRHRETIVHMQSPAEDPLITTERFMVRDFQFIVEDYFEVP